MDLTSVGKEKETYLKDFVDKLRVFNKVMLWGLSESADAAIDFFNENNIVVNGIYDNDINKNGTYYRNIIILNPGDEVNDKNTALVITCSYYENIRKSLLVNDSNIDDRLFMFDGYFLEDNIYYNDDNVLNMINNNYNLLNDDKSKVLYKALLKYRDIRDINLIKDLYDSRSDCYLDEVFISRFRSGLYIDAGSYNADFITTLSDRVDVSDSKFYIFEPNKYFSKSINDNLDGKYNFKVFQMALCDIEGEMEFQQIESSTSHLVDKKYNAYKDKLDKTVELVKINTLDNVVGDEVVTGIKVDIEGSEQAMLLGSENIIKRDRPFMMISIYHKWDDLWKIQDYINSLNLNYKFYIRHYSLSVAKTILYCIPE